MQPSRLHQLLLLLLITCRWILLYSLLHNTAGGWNTSQWSSSRGPSSTNLAEPTNISDNIPQNVHSIPGLPPQKFSRIFMDNLLPAVTIIGASYQRFLVRVEVVEHRARLTEGCWPLLSRVTKQPSPHGLRTNWANQDNEWPAIWNIEVANGYEQVRKQCYHLVHHPMRHPLNYGGPNPVMAMHYILGPSLGTTGNLVTALRNAWVSFGARLQKKYLDIYLKLLFHELPKKCCIAHHNNINSVCKTLWNRVDYLSTYCEFQSAIPSSCCDCIQHDDYELFCL